MTITSVTPTFVQTPGNGVAVTFSFPMKIFQAADLVVGFIVGGVYAQQLTGFTVNNVDVNGGGSVTFTVAPPIGTTVDLRTQTPQTQATEFANLGTFLPEAHTEAFDRITRVVQDLTRQAVTFSIHGPDTEGTAWPALPVASSRVNTGLVFDGNGLPAVGVLTAQPVTQSLLLSLLTQQGLGTLFYPQTPAESAAGITPVNYFYPTLDIRRYGADPKGVAFSDTAFAFAVLACGSAGGTIRVPGGSYLFANPITLQGSSSIVVQGDGATTGGATPATQFIYTGTGSGTWINCNSATGVQFKGIQLTHNQAGFLGTYLTFNHGGPNTDATFCGLFDCVLGASISGTTHLNLDKCINFTAERCNFLSGNPSVVGALATGGSYSNVIRFRDCQWSNSLIVPVNPNGQAWTFEGCNFENLSTGAAGALAAGTGVAPCIGLKVTGCWFGDVSNTAPAGTWIDGSYSGAEFSGNYFSGNATSNNTTAFVMRQSNGVAIIGNSFNSLLNLINFAVANCTGIVFKGNIANSVANIYVNPQNVPLGNLDFSLGFGLGIPTGHGQQTSSGGYTVCADGTIIQYGFAVNQSHGSNTITFPRAFPNACIGVVATLSSVASTAATIDTGPFTTTTFVATITDGSSTTDSFSWYATGY